jgi:hypothetical protein
MRFEDIPTLVKKQYVSLYGEFVSGDYAPGDEIPGLGEVLWSYQGEKGLTYVCSDGGFPSEILASEVKA